MKVYILLFLCASLIGCPRIITGLVKNESSTSVFHVTHWKPVLEPIPKGETRKVRLFSFGACIELVVAGESRYFEVPVPPSDSQIGSSLYSATLNDGGLFFVGHKEQPVQFSEVPDCDG